MSLRPVFLFLNKIALLALSIGILSGCATQSTEGEKCVSAINPETGIAPKVCTQAPPLYLVRPPVSTPAKLTALGYGAPGSFSQFTPGQQKLMAMRAAQVDAYRNLAEQVYGFRVWGNTAVSAFTTQNDNVRSYVDAFIRGARVVNVTPVIDGNFEATVELDVSQNFLDTLRRQVGSEVHSSNQGSCSTPGCALSSAHYVSN